VLLAGGHLLPWVLLLPCFDAAANEGYRDYFVRHIQPHMERPDVPEVSPPGFAARIALGLSVLACWLSLVPRLACAWLYRQSLLGAISHPVGVLLMLAIQWYATVRAWVGRPVGWKGRGHPTMPRP
jgi:hypothetical protein